LIHFGVGFGGLGYRKFDLAFERSNGVGVGTTLRRRDFGWRYSHSLPLLSQLFFVKFLCISGGFQGGGSAGECLIQSPR
jgi:hypothetical protein